MPTILQQPDTYTPANNPQIFRVSSTNTGNAGFSFTFVITDLLTGDNYTHQVEPKPSETYCVYDASTIVRDYVKNYIPNNEYGWQPCVDAIRQIRVNCGETFISGGVPTYFAGSNVDYYAWNASIDTLEYPDFLTTDYVYKNSTSNWKYLTKLLDPNNATFITYKKTSYTDHSLFLYGLTSESLDLQYVRVNTYNSAGTLIGTSDIINPYTSSSNYYEKYLCIDIGVKGLTNIDAGDVSGTYPIITSSVAYYDVIDAYDTGLGLAARTKNYTRVYVGCEPKFDVFTLHYKTQSGMFETLSFSKKSEIKLNNEKLTYGFNAWELIGSDWTYQKKSAFEKVLTSYSQKEYILNTDWLNQTECDEHSEIINSPEVYMDMGSTIGLIPVIVKTNSLTYLRRWNSDLKSIQINVRLTFKNIH